MELEQKDPLTVSFILASCLSSHKYPCYITSLMLSYSSPGTISHFSGTSVVMSGHQKLAAQLSHKDSSSWDHEPLSTVLDLIHPVVIGLFTSE